VSIRRSRTTLAKAAVRLARLLGPDDCVLVGGLAVGVHGYVRATDDLDFVGRRPLAEIRDTLRKAGIETRTRRGDVLDGGFSCVKGEIDGIPFDVLPPLVPVDWDRAVALEMPGGTLKVVDLDSLLQLKIRAGGPQDLLDAARLVLLHREVEPRAVELAVAYGARDRLEAWLSDPRTRAQAREDAEREAGPAKKARPARRGPRIR
jgi:hypothetical protein